MVETITLTPERVQVRLRVTDFAQRRRYLRHELGWEHSCEVAYSWLDRQCFRRGLLLKVPSVSAHQEPDPNLVGQRYLWAFGSAVPYSAIDSIQYPTPEDREFVITSIRHHAEPDREETVYTITENNGAGA